MKSYDSIVNVPAGDFLTLDYFTSINFFHDSTINFSREYHRLYTKDVGIIYNTLYPRSKVQTGLVQKLVRYKVQ